MIGLGRLLLLSFLPFLYVRSRSLCVSSKSNFQLKISRARLFVFTWFPSAIPCIRRQFRLKYCSSRSTCSVILLSFSFKEETSPRSSSITFFYFCFSFPNSSNLSDINFIDLLRSADSFSPLIWLLLLESANLCISLSSFSKFRKQLSKIFTQSSDFRLSSKTSPGYLDGLPSLCYLASSSVLNNK